MCNTLLIINLSSIPWGWQHFKRNKKYRVFPCLNPRMTKFRNNHIKLLQIIWWEKIVQKHLSHYFSLYQNKLWTMHNFGHFWLLLSFKLAFKKIIEIIFFQVKLWKQSEFRFKLYPCAFLHCCDKEKVPSAIFGIICSAIQHFFLGGGIEISFKVLLLPSFKVWGCKCSK